MVARGDQKVYVSYERKRLFSAPGAVVSRTPMLGATFHFVYEGFYVLVTGFRCVFTYPRLCKVLSAKVH